MKRDAHQAQFRNFREFIPDLRNQMIPANSKFQALPIVERERITESWVQGFNRLHDIVSGVERRSVNLTPDLEEIWRGAPLESKRSVIEGAVQEGDADFFIKLGHVLQSRSLTEFNESQYLAHRVSLFLLFWWISWSPKSLPEISYHSRGIATLLLPHAFIPSDDTCHVLPEKRNVPGLCFLSYGALEAVCRRFLKDPSIKKDALRKTIERLGLLRCQSRPAMFSKCEMDGDRIWLR